LAERDLLDALKLLVSAELVFARGTAPKASYVFKHALVRDAAYESLLMSQRRRIHAGIADWLVANAPDVLVQAPELVAQHYAKSGQRGPAITWWSKAGDRALQQSANAEAINHFSAAIAEIAGLPQAEQARAELPLQIGLGSALTAVQGYSHPATGAAYRRGRDLAVEIGDPHRLMSVLHGVWNYDAAGGRFASARRTADEMMELARCHAETSLFVSALCALGSTQALQGDWTDGSRNLRRCIELYDIAAHATLKFELSEDPCVQALNHNAICLWSLGQEDQAIRSLNDGLALAERIEHANSIGLALGWRCYLHYMRSDGSAALQAVGIMREKLANQDLPLWVSVGEIYGAWAEAVAGARRDGLSQWEKGMMAFKDTGGGTMLPTFHGMLAEIHLQFGRLDEAYAAACEGLSIAVANEERACEAELHRLKAQSYLRRNPPMRNLGEQALLAALEVARRQQAKAMELRTAVNLATLWHEMGRGNEAETLLDQACRLFDDLPETAELARAQALLKTWKQSDSR
jgi:predicted ATPase